MEYRTGINCKCPLCDKNCECIGDGISSDFYSCEKYWKIKTEHELFRKSFTTEEIKKINKFLHERNQKEHWQEIITFEILNEILDK